MICGSNPFRASEEEDEARRRAKRGMRMIPAGPAPLLLLTLTVSSLLAAFLLLGLLKTLLRSVGRGRLGRARRPPSPPPPPGIHGIPLVGETLSFLSADRSGKGFYEFVRARRIR